jgi:Salmonella virulence plasmid 65kDa B protein
MMNTRASKVPILLPILLAFTAPAIASISNTVPSEVSSANGGFRTEVAFELPAFHGLEPALGVVYDASRTNGFVGVGWKLAGQSRIVARRPKGGVPLYDGTDSYSLDGTLLYACSGARCLGTGGTHIGETHHFERIVRDGQERRLARGSARARRRRARVHR